MIFDFLENLYSDWNEFIVLSAEDMPIDGASFVQAFWNDDILHTEIGVLTEENPKLPSMKMICLWKRAENYS